MRVWGDAGHSRRSDGWKSSSERACAIWRPKFRPSSGSLKVRSEMMMLLLLFNAGPFLA